MIIGQRGVLSTPAVSSLIRRHKVLGKKQKKNTHNRVFLKLFYYISCVYRALYCAINAINNEIVNNVFKIAIAKHFSSTCTTHDE